MDLARESSYPTPFTTSPLFPLLLMSLATQKQAPKTSSSFKEEYDYIVVGSGSAGSVVASRLSELPCINVLLLEAGGTAPIVNDVPSVSRSFVATDLDWKYLTTPQLNTGAAMVNRQITWPSGKGLGGSSLLNAMLYVRGNRKNYDDWAKHGAIGWNYDDVLPYFKKLEDYQDPEYLDNGFHSASGPITVMKPNYTSEIKVPLIDAAEELGYKFVDSNGPTQSGFYNFRATLRNGQRCSTAKAYLVPAEDRTNLDILTNAMVRKVLINISRETFPDVLTTTRAYGVQFDYNGTTYEVRARNEVIMSAGTTNTAQLLMLSGIGPRTELQKFNIPVLADIPAVGQNLQDHVGAFTAFTINNSIPKFREKLADDTNIRNYIENRAGPLVAPEAVSLFAFLPKCMLLPDLDRPDYQLYFLEGLPQLLVTQSGMTQQAFDTYYGPYINSTFYWCISSNLESKSSGYVGLRSADPYDPPVIDPRYFSNPIDRKLIVEGMKTCNRIAGSKSMQPLNAQPLETVFPGCESFVNQEDLYLDCQARSLAISFNHQVGTAKMGNPADPKTVVDPQLRVKGVQGLRVVDASIMPSVPWGNTNVPTIMVAEKGSDIIKSGISCPAGSF